MSVPPLETERLILRPLMLDDLSAVFKWTGAERVMEKVGLAVVSGIVKMLTVLWSWGLGRSPRRRGSEQRSASEGKAFPS